MRSHEDEHGDRPPSGSVERVMSLPVGAPRNTIAAMTRTLAMLAALSFTSPASAQHLAEALQAYESGDIAGARSSLARFFEEPERDRDELVRYYELSALLAFADEEHDRMTEALTALAALEPAHELSGRFPPQIREALQRIRDADTGPALRVDIEATSPRPELARLDVRVGGRGRFLVEEVVARVRTPDARWRDLGAGRMDVPVPGGGHVEFFAELVGPAGIVVARAGSRTEPLSMAVEEESESAWPFVLVTGASVLLVGAGVAIGLAIYFAGQSTVVFDSGDVHLP